MVNLKHGLVACAAACVCVSAQAELGFNANVELNNVYKSQVKAAGNARASDYDTGGRLELNATGKTTMGDYLVEGKATGLLKTDGETAVGDIWIALGNSVANMKIGRFEATDLFPLGQDTVVDLGNLYGGYRANVLRGRFGHSVDNNNDQKSTHAALTLNASKALSFELGLVRAKSCRDADVLAQVCKSQIKQGVRPVAQYVSGPITLRLGAESVRAQGTTKTQSGFGATAAYNYGSGTVNANLAKSENHRSFGLNAIYHGFGLGLIYSKGDTSAQKSAVVYASYKASLFGLKGAYITPAISVAKGGAGSKQQTAANIRLNYDF